MINFLKPLGMPALTFPFCITTLVCKNLSKFVYKYNQMFLQLGEIVKVDIVKSSQMTTPEVHWWYLGKPPGKNLFFPKQHALLSSE